MGQLCPQRSYEVQIARDEPFDKAQATLVSLLENSEAVVPSEAERTLRFPTIRSESELADVLHRLVRAGVKVTQFREVTSDLEDAFLTVAAAHN